MDTNMQLLTQVNKLSVDERIKLVEAVWDGIAEQKGALSLTEEQRVELDRRLLEHKAYPEDVIPWNKVKASILTRLRK